MSILREFKEFAVRGNMVDMMVGIIVGVGFSDLINSFVRNVVLPPLSLLTGEDSLRSRYWQLTGDPYPTLEEAEAAGAVIVRYGEFLNQLIDFVLIAFVVFLVVRTLNKLHKEEEK